MKLTADINVHSQARIDAQHLDGEGTHFLTIATGIDEIEFQGSLEDIEDIIDSLNHDLMLLRSPRRQSETLPLSESAA